MDIDCGRIPPGPQEPYRDTEDLLDWMSHQFAAFGDIYKASMYGTSIYAVRDPDYAEHVLVGHWQNYVKGQFIKRVAFLLGNGLMVSEADVWKRQRRMVQPAFDRATISLLVDTIASVNLRLCQSWQLAASRSEAVNVSRDVSRMALEVMLRFIFGDDYEEAAPHFEIVSQETGRDLAFANAFRGLRKIIAQVARRRRGYTSSQMDALGTLMRARDPQTGQSMGDSQLVNEILTLIVAGHETTASTLNWMWFLLSQHPAVERKLSDEVTGLTAVPGLDGLPQLPWSRQVIEETMRLFPAGWLITRRALRDDQLGEYFVPAGTEIFIPPYFIQRNPKVWHDPDSFIPDRFAPENSKNRHRLATIPFSSGPRNCIGALLARTEMQIHLLTVASQLRLRYSSSKSLEVDAGVNLRSRYDFMMYPETTKKMGLGLESKELQEHSR